MPKISRIAEIDATFFVNRNVVRRIELLPFKQTSNDLCLASFHVRPRDFAATVVRTFGHDHVACRIELDTV